jgi:hypothetical protein
MNSGAAIRSRYRNVGFHAAFKGPTGSFFRHSKTNRDTFERTTGFVCQLNGDRTLASGAGAVYRAFSFNNLNAEECLRE